MNTIEYLGQQIHFTDFGNGKTITMLHGFMESIEIWGDFATTLSNNHRVICIDLPGHGKSGSWDEIHTMDFMAEVVHVVLSHLGITKTCMIGHSLGGYVTLSFAQHFPDFLSGYSLFHSTPFPDTEERKINRERQIEFVKQGKKDLVYNVLIPNTYAEYNLTKFAKEIEFGKDIAKRMTDQGIFAALGGMKIRPDRSFVIEELPIPFLFILGLGDKIISSDILQKLPMNEEYSSTLILENSGHMGFIEEHEKSLSAIDKFVSSLE